MRVQPAENFDACAHHTQWRRSAWFPCCWYVTLNKCLTYILGGRQSGSPFSITEQANAVAAETSTLLGFARGTQYPRFLGWLLLVCCLTTGAGTSP